MDIAAVLPTRIGNLTAAPDEHVGPTRLAILDHRDVVRRGVSRLVRSVSDITLVAESRAVSDLRALLGASRPHVLVLDIDLPDGDGIDLCRELRERAPAVRCLIFTTRDDERTVVAAVKAGAAGYLLKNAPGPTLLTAIRHVAAGRSTLDPAVTAHLLSRLRHGEPTDARFDTLSDREHGILTLITGGMTNRQIGAELFLSEKTIKNHVSSLFGKLAVQRRSQAAVLGVEHDRQNSERLSEGRALASVRTHRTIEAS